MEIKRDRYLKQLIESRQNGFIKVVTGIRRCGKSYLLNVLFYHYLLDNGVADDHIIRIDLEDSGFTWMVSPRPRNSVGISEDRK